MKPYQEFLRSKIRLAHCKAAELKINVPSLFDMINDAA